MADIFVTIDGIDSLIASFARFIPVVNTALLAGGEDVKGAAAQYPQQTHITRKSVYGTSFKTDRQRRWFFAVGIHETPYSRTGQLGQRWNVQNPSPLTVVVGNQSPYGGYVQGGANDKPAQSLYHKAQGWKNTDTIANEKSQAVGEKVARAIEQNI